jgi:anti-sigma factor ChrR (cupin superfamily)
LNSKPDQHSQKDLELVLMYLLEALPSSSEKARVAAHISGCEQCDMEMKRLRPIVESLVPHPTGVPVPPASLWERLTQRIAQETSKKPPVMTPPLVSISSEWEQVTTGISVKLLSTNIKKHQVAMLVQLAPGTDYPPHRHAGVEELYLLDGVLIIDDKTLYPGDYIRADAGSVDHRVWSKTGCTCVLLTSREDEIL